MKREAGFYYRLLVGMCIAAYFVSYISRINYGAVLLEIVRTEGISKVDASMAVTGSFITYGAGQLVSGWLGDRLKPRYLLFSGLLLSAAMNLFVPLFASPGLILLFWCVNGFAQALMWPPMVRLLSDYLENAAYKKSCVYVTWGSSLGTIAIYLAAPACILWKGWRSLFFLCAGTTLAFAFVWFYAIVAVERHLPLLEEGASAGKTGSALGKAGSAAEKAGAVPGGLKDGKSGLPRGAAPLLAVIMCAIVMQGMLRDGITTWMPTYVSEVFGLSSSASILTGVALPLFGMASLQLTSVLNRRLISNELCCAAAVFFPGFAAALLLALFPAGSAAVSVLLTALITGCMYGVNVILVSMIPPYFRKYGKVSTISGLLNSCTYVGSAISSYGIAWVAEKSGWGTVIVLWTLAALAGTVLCAAAGKRWGRFERGAENKKEKTGGSYENISGILRHLPEGSSGR
ncbi:MAG: MFS transporter [Eubacteriales bacterium]|nr:MFS transporter [Eubacteriales bacterium]